MEKRYWTPEDYDRVITEIAFKTPAGEEYPRFSNPDTAPVLQKLVNPENYQVILEDPELGLNYKNEVSENFFHQYKQLVDAYSKEDRQDKYIYAEELVAIEKFGLGLQIQYFKLGNDRILQNSDSHDSTAITRVLRSNENTIIGNFDIYLDEIKEAEHFSTAAPLLADGITTHFFKLIETFPDANYAPMIEKASAALEKTKLPELRSALTSLLEKLKATKKP